MLKKVLAAFIGILLTQQEVIGADNFFGPLLNFRNTDGEKWNLSALVVAPQNTDPSSLTLSFRNSDETLSPSLIDTVQGQNFWNYTMSLARGELEQKITYQIGSKAFDIFVPVQHTDPHVFFGSCNEYADLSSPTWKNIQSVHGTTPYHVAFYAGDQIYLDTYRSVFDLPSIKPVFSQTSDKIKAFNTTPEIEEQITTFVLEHYQQHYSKPDFSTFVGSVPAQNMSDDHEYFNGKGSYYEIPPLLETVTKVADRFYYLFQHHTKKENAASIELIGPDGVDSHSLLTQFENSAFYALDTRSERTPSQVTSSASRQFMFDRLNELPQQNIFVITGLPLVYQNFHLIEFGVNLFGYTDLAKNFMRSLNNDSVPWFANLNVTTDFMDQWSHPNHIQEKKEILQNLDKLVSKGKTVTLLGGDAHSASAGEVLDSASRVRMRQLTSSALTSSPTPDLAVGLKELNRNLQGVTSLGNNLTERLIILRNMAATGETSMDLARNNWLDLTLEPNGSYPLFFVNSASQDPKAKPLEIWLPAGWTYPKGNSNFTVDY